MNKKSLFNKQSLLKNIFLIFFVFLFSISFISKSGARIYLNYRDIDNISQEKHIDILYINDNLDMAWHNQDNTHGNEKLSNADILLVNKYLDKWKTDYTNKNTQKINQIIDKLRRPDLPLSYVYREPNTQEKELINQINNDPNWMRLLLVLRTSIVAYDDIYKGIFNNIAKETDYTYDYDFNVNTWGVDQTFRNKIADNLSNNILTSYSLFLKDYLKDKTSTTTDIIKKRLDEIIEKQDSIVGDPNIITINSNSLGAAAAVSGKELTYKISDFVKLDIENATSSSAIRDISDNSAQQAGSNISQNTNCTATNIMGIINDGNCSIVAYFINSFLNLINVIVGYINNLVGEVFGWVFDITVVKFSDWVSQSNAITIYKTILLSLITSLVLPLVFYLIIRMLIDNNTSNIEKLLPKILFMALFVYFSFGITGWIIDQSNIISIYLYRSMTHVQDGDMQNIGEVMSTALKLDNGSGIAQSSAEAPATATGTAYTLGQLLINIVALFVIIQAMVLIFVRGIILLMSMIFSPLMFMPAGLGGSIGKFIDDWRGKLIDYFTGNLLLGPIFMTLLFIALKVASVGTELTKSAPNVDLPGAPPGQNFLSGAITTVMVIVLLEAAITVAKQMSGELGQKISGKINSFVGGNAMNLAGFAGRRTLGSAAQHALNENSTLGKWVKKNEGTTAGKLMKNGLKNVAGSSFDLRNSDKVKSVANFAGADMNQYGKGSQKSASKKYEQSLYNAKKYYNGLTEEAKRDNIERLKGVFGGEYGKQIAKELEKNPKNSMKEKLDQDPEFNKKFNDANQEKDKIKRDEEIEKTINEHFKDNKFGDKYFSNALQDPKNNDLKEKYKKALDEKDDNKRKNALTGLVTGFENQNKSREKEIKEEIKKKQEIEEEIKNNNGFSGTSSSGIKYNLREEKNNTNNSSDSNTIKNQTEEIKRQTENFSKGIGSLGDKLDKLTDVIRSSQKNNRFGSESSKDYEYNHTKKEEEYKNLKIAGESKSSDDNDIQKGITIVQGFRNRK